MTYSFVDINTSKFSINGRELFKTFIPVYVNEQTIRVVNIYDSRFPLIPNTSVSEIEFDGQTYANATLLNNAIHDALFSRAVSGDIDNAQIEANRLAIIDLSSNKANASHNHDNRYYTQTQVDQMLQNLAMGGSFPAKGRVDGDNIVFEDSKGVDLFSVDAKTFIVQGSIIEYKNKKVVLKDSSGNELSSAEVEADKLYYDVYYFQSDLETDLNDLIQNENFTIAKTIEEDFYFVSSINNTERFEGSRIILDVEDTPIDLDTPSIITENFKAWSIPSLEYDFVQLNKYKFEYWIRRNQNFQELTELGAETNKAITTAGYKKLGKTDEDIPLLGGGDFKKSEIDAKLTSVDSINSLRALEKKPSENTINVLNYYSDSEGGGGEFKWNSTSTLDDDGGSIIKPDNVLTDEAGRWERIFKTPLIDIRFFGAKDGTDNNYEKITKALEFSYSKKENISPIGQVWAKIPTVVIPSGTYGVEQTLLVKLGINLLFEGGVLKATAEIDRVIWTEQQALDYEPGVYGTKYLKIYGTGFIDGNNLASVGLWANTISESEIRGITAINCTRKKWNDAPITAISNSLITVSDTSEFEERDFVRIFNNTTGLYERDAFNIGSIESSTQIKLNTSTKDIDTGANSYSLVFIPCGFSLCGNQNIYEKLTALKNTCGFAFSMARFQSGTSFILGHDDNTHTRLYSHDNDFGAIYSSYNAFVNFRSTFQHNNYENLICSDVNFGNFLSLYCEVGSNFISLNSEDYPLGYISGAGTKVNVKVPTNTNQGWYRPFEVDGTNIEIDINGSLDVLENPNVVDDFAVIKLSGKKTTGLKVKLSGYRNIQRLSNIKKSVVDTNYNFPRINCIVETFDWATGRRFVFGDVRNGSKLEMFNGNDKVSLAINENGSVIFYDANGENPQEIKQVAPNYLETSKGLQIREKLKLKSESGLDKFIWIDGENRIRYKNTNPGVLDNDGYVLDNKIVKVTTNNSTHTLDFKDKNYIRVFKGSISEIFIDEGSFKKDDVVTIISLESQVKLTGNTGVTLNTAYGNSIKQGGCVQILFTADNSAILLGDIIDSEDTFEPLNDRLENLADDLDETEQDSIKEKIGIVEIEQDSGVFTPALAVTGGATITSTLSYANYSKIGNVCTFALKFTNIDTSAAVSNEVFTVVSLPFTALQDTLVDYFLTDASGGNGSLRCEVKSDEIELDYVTLSYDGDGTSASELIVSGSFIVDETPV